MIRKHLRLILAGLIFAASVALIVMGHIGSGIWLILLSSLFVLFHFKNEKNLLAFLFLRRNKLNTAGKVLGWVKNPENMIKGQEAFHYFMTALVDAQLNKVSKAEKGFKLAIRTGLRMKSDQAVASLNLSGIYLNRRNKKLSKYFLGECKKLDKNKMLSNQVKEIEYMMKRI